MSELSMVGGVLAKWVSCWIEVVRPAGAKGDTALAEDRPERHPVRVRVRSCARARGALPDAGASALIPLR
jgi:hypothetical protein